MSRKQQEERLAVRLARRDRVFLAVSAVLPEIAEGELDRIRKEIGADRGHPLCHLDDHFAAHPDALTSTDSRCPPAFVRFVNALRAAGHSGIATPGCSVCGRTDIELPFNSPIGRSCKTCVTKAQQQTCARCGQLGTITARRAEGGICHLCYRKDPQVVEECSGCGRSRAPSVRLPGGKALCDNCRPPLQQICTACGLFRPAKTRSDGPLCRSCYDKTSRPRRTCGKCGLVTVIARRAVDGAPDLCANCAGLLPPAPCSICGKIKPGYRHAQHGFVCRACRPHRKEDCANCGETRRIHTNWPMGPVCQACYTRILDHPEPCATCRDQRPLIARSDDGQKTCGPCSGSDFDYACTGCSTHTRLYAERLCPRCALQPRLQRLLTGTTGSVSEQMRPLLAALAAADNPRGVLGWLAKSPTAKLLSDLARRGDELTHELLDTLPQGRTEQYVRQLLVHTGVLPSRNEDIERVPAWLNQTLAEHPPEHSRLINPFVHWFLLKRARRRATRSTHPVAAASRLRTQVRAALDLLTWLDQRDRPLHALTQEHLEEWLSTGPRHRYEIRRFLEWAMDRRLVQDLTVPTPVWKEPAEVLDEQQRWNKLSQCIHDPAVPLDVRVAGALVLLFGLPTTRIRHLKIEHIREESDGFYLDFGPKPLFIPPKLADLIRQLAIAPNPSRVVTREAQATWLFPGRNPGKPAVASGFSRKLREHGIDVRPARNAAIIALINDLPAPILADLLDLHPITTDRWASIAKRDWTGYLAIRAQDAQGAANARVDTGGVAYSTVASCATGQAR